MSQQASYYFHLNIELFRKCRYQDVREQVFTESSESGQSGDSSCPHGGVLQDHAVVDVPDVASRVGGPGTFGSWMKGHKKPGLGNSSKRQEVDAIGKIKSGKIFLLKVPQIMRHKMISLIPKLHKISTYDVRAGGDATKLVSNAIMFQAITAHQAGEES